MTCFYPRPGIRPRSQELANGLGELTANGKLRITILHQSEYDSYMDIKARLDNGEFISDYWSEHEIISIPCNNCLGCRLKRRRDWALRSWCEGKMHSQNCFITLTYAPEFIADCCPDVSESLSNDPIYSLDKAPFQKFMKRLREWLSRNTNLDPISFLHCGEYGDKFQRPHEHAILFGFDPRLIPGDTYVSFVRGKPIYHSLLLEKLWPFGLNSVGDLTTDSAGYVAGYITKKINGSLAEKHYNGRLPEYLSMSLKPAIGKRYFEKYGNIYPNDFIVNDNGFKCPPPRYFDNLLNAEDIELYEQVKAARENKFRELGVPGANKSYELALKERYAQYQHKRRLEQRSYENV